MKQEILSASTGNILVNLSHIIKLVKGEGTYLQLTNVISNLWRVSKKSGYWIVLAGFEFIGVY